MSTEAGELVVRIVSDSGNLRSDVERQVNGAAQGAVAASGRTLSQVGKQARDMGAKMSLAATLPLAALGKSAVDAASATTEATNKVNVVFGDAADEVLAFSETSARAFGISRREALAASGTFGNLFRAMGVGQKQAADTSVTMTELAGDLASFNDADPTEVLDALRAGLIGEAEPMRRFGVQLSEARVQAEALAQGLVKPTKNATEIAAANLKVEAAIKAQATALRDHGKGSAEARQAAVDLAESQEQLKDATKGSVPELTDQQKLLARQSIILKDTELAQGDFQRSLDSSAANQERVSKALADDAQAAIGEQLLPLYQKAVVKLGELAAAFGDLSPEAQRNVLILVGVAAAAGPLLTIFGNLIRLGSGVAKGIGLGVTAAKATVDAAKRMADGYRNAQAAQSSFSGAAGTIGGKLKSAQTALVNSAKAAGQWAAQTGRAAAQGAANMARAAARNVASLTRLAAAYAAQGARMAASMARTAARVVAQWVLMAARSLAQAARMAASWLIAMGPIGLAIAAVVGLVVLVIKNWDRIKSATAAAWEWIVGKVTGAASALAGAVSSGISRVVGFFTGLPGRIRGAIGSAGTMLLDTGRDIVNGLIDGIVGMGGALAGAISSFISSNVPGPVKKLLGIASPSKVFREIGQWVVRGLIKGLTGDAADVKAASEKLADMVTDAYKQRAKANDGELSKADRRRRDALLRLIDTQQREQTKLAKRHATLLRDLTRARENLKELQQEARQYAADVATALVDSANITNALPEGVAVTTQSLTERLRQQVEQAQAFAANIAQLTAAGLNATTLQQLVDAGVEGGSLMAQELAAATPEQIAELNALQQQLAATGRSLGQTAADELYGAGIRAAEGLVRGLEREEARIERVMARQAQRFANRIREALGQELHDFNGKRRGLYDQVTKGGGGNGRKDRERIDNDGRGRTTNINTTVNNPKPERASESVPKRLRRLQQTGALD